MQMCREARTKSRSEWSWLRRSRGQSPQPSARGSGRSLPGGVGVAARKELHLREQMPEMLAVVAAASTEDGPLVGWGFELGFGENGRDRRAIFGLEHARIQRASGIDRRLQPLVHLEQLADEPPGPAQAVAH